MTRRPLLAALVLCSLAGCASPPAGEVITTPAPASAQPAPLAVPAVAPAALIYERLGIDTRLDWPGAALGLDPDRTIEEPPVAQPQLAGWYRFGPMPGAAGPAVVLGHVNGDGGSTDGVFAELSQAQAGDEVRVVRADDSAVLFTVTRVERVPKDAFPTDAVYGDTAGAEIRLITCGGEFDRARGHYVDNWIVYGVAGRYERVSAVASRA